MKPSTTSTKLPSLVSTAILGTLALTCGAPSMAADGEHARQDNVRQVVVRYGDLNISNAQGAAMLYRRIAAAADDVCNADYGIRELGLRANVDACVRKAISGAVNKVGRPELFAIYNARNPLPLGIPLAVIQAR